MKLTNEMMKTIEDMIKAAVEKKTGTVSVFCGICDKSVEVIVSSQANIEAEINLEKLGEGIIPLINDATRLIWERAGEKIFLKTGYVVFYDEVESDPRNDILLEEYNIIEDGEFSYSGLYVDGKEHTCGFSFSGKCKYYYEFDMDNFRFERCLPERNFMSKEINWQIDDGYVGKCRPQKTKIDDNELLECESKEEVIELIYDFVQEDFNNKICYSIDNMNELIKYWEKNRIRR